MRAMKLLLGAILIAGLAAPAMADKVGTDYLLRTLDGRAGATTQDLTVLDVDTRSGFFLTVIDISGLPSVDFFGHPDNIVFNVRLGPDAYVFGLGWNTWQEAFSPSWLSEMEIALTDTAVSEGVSLAPGFEDDEPGKQTYSSGGIIDLTAFGLDFFVGGDGLLRVELWESFVDFDGPTADGVYHPTLRGRDPEASLIFIAWVPEPGTLALLTLGHDSHGPRVL
jgi:hypothetical protein